MGSINELDSGELQKEERKEGRKGAREEGREEKREKVKVGGGCVGRGSRERRKGE